MHEQNFPSRSLARTGGQQREKRLPKATGEERGLCGGSCKMVTYFEKLIIYGRCLNLALILIGAVDEVAIHQTPEA